MALVLTVDEAQWRPHLHRTIERVGDRLVPVVKGNGYGFGRAMLADLVEELGLGEIAVGTVEELLATPLRQHVLTPSLDDHLDAVPATAVLTVGSLAQARAARHGGSVAVKLRSSMLRYGVAPDRLGELLTELDRAGRAVDRFVLHLPLAGTDDDRVAEIEAWLPHLPVDATVSVSHLDPARFERLAASHRGRSWQLRLGTALWHGDKGSLRLGADVLECHPVAAGTPAGYRLTPAPADGHLLLIAAGSAHGVQPLADGRSPFHFARTRLALLEAPHMHTSMAFVPIGEPCPAPGEIVDVQRPLTQVWPDRTVWVR